MLILILTIATISSCSNDDDSLRNQITAEWKLIRAEFYELEGGNPSESLIDYSDQNIIYDFKSNGTLIVSGGENAGYYNGNYEYFFGEDHLGGGMSDPKILLVTIDQTKWTYDLKDGKLTLGLSHVDGPDLVFERK